MSALDSSSQSQEIFEKIGKSNGLSSNRITSIVKTENGFVYLLPKMVLSSNEKLILGVKELKGNRRIELSNK